MKPTKRVVNGKTVWVARYRDQHGRQRIYKPAWNNHRGTFALRKDAQRALNEIVFEDSMPVEDYLHQWLRTHPRSLRTNATNKHRIERVLDFTVDGSRFGEWMLRQVRRRHVVQLIDHLFGEGRSASGVANILRACSAMFSDGMNDELCDLNPFTGHKVRADDPRARKQSRQSRVFSFMQLRSFALAAGEHRLMVDVFATTGMRLGEVLALRWEDYDGESLHVRRTAHNGVCRERTKTGRDRPVPVPPSVQEGLDRVRRSEGIMFPTPNGMVWREENFRRDVWKPAQEALGLDIRPHEMRHSFVSLLNAERVDQADLADMVGHRVETMNARYRHPLRRSFDQVRELVG